MRAGCPQGQRGGVRAGPGDPRSTHAGDRWLRTLLAECALAAIRTKDAPFGARYRRVLRHRGRQKAVVAVAHALLRTIYHVLASGQAYHNLGLQTLERLGFKVTIEAAA